MRAAGASGAATLEMKGNDDLMGKEGELTQSRTMHAEVSPPPRSHSRPSRMKHKAHVMPSVRLTQEAFWCGTAGRLPHCSNLLSVVILLLQVIILLLYFALHCTAVLDDMMDEPDARFWVGVTPGVQVLCWIVLPASIFHTVYTLGEITCCWRKTVDGRQRLQKQHTSDDVAKDTPAGGCLGWVSTVCSSWLYHLSTRSPYFFYKTWLSELYEFVFQVLAIEEFSRAGISRFTLCAMTTVVFFNAFSPVLVTMYARRTNHDRLLLGRVTQRVLLFDAVCDTFYSVVPLVTVLVRYLRLGVVSERSAFVAPEFADLCNRIGAGDGDTAGQRHLVSGTGGTNCPDLKSYILLSHGKEVLFGGRSLWEIFVKINTRVVPLIYAPQRVKAAFNIKYAFMIFDDDTDAGGQAKKEEEKQRHIGGVELVVGETGKRSITKTSVLRGGVSPSSHHQQSLQVTKESTHKETSLDEGSEQEESWGGGEGGRGPEHIASSASSTASPTVGVTVEAKGATLSAKGWAYGKKRGPSAVVSPATAVDTKEGETEGVRWERGDGKSKEEKAPSYTTNSAILPTDDSGTTTENYLHADTPTTATTAKEGRMKSGQKRRSARGILEKRWDEQRMTYHRPVPVTLVFSGFTVCILLCLFIFVRLATWGECPGAPGTRSFDSSVEDNGTTLSSTAPAACLVASYPLFGWPTEHESCECNTFLFDERVAEGCGSPNNTALREQLVFAIGTTSFSTVLLNLPCRESVPLAQALILNLSAAEGLTVLEVNAWGSHWKEIWEEGTEGDGFVPSATGVDTNGDDEGWDNVVPNLAKCTAISTLSLNNMPVTRMGWTENMAQLKSMALKRNFITMVPTVVGRLKELTYFSVTHGRLSRLPTELGLLTKIFHLNFQYQRLTSLPEELGRLSLLSSIWLDGQRVLSSLPDSFGGLTNLEAIYMDANNFTALPAAIIEIAQHSQKLRRLHISDNMLLSLPVEFARLTNLWRLRVSGNRLTHIPIEIWNSWTNIVTLYLHDNRLTLLPSSVGKMTKLESMRLSRNRLSRVPREIGRLARLTQLDLAFNRLRQLPTEIGELAALASLTLDGNRLADMPTQIGQAAALTKLSLRRNQLTRVPMEMSTLVQLTYLALAANKLTECPTVATRMTKLKLLNLDNNSITSCTAFAPRGAAAAEGGEAAAASSTVPDNETRVLLGRNPVCDSGGAARGMLFGAQWSISCEAVCATGCVTGSWDSSCVKC